MEPNPADKQQPRQQLKNIAKSGLGVLLALVVTLGDALSSILMRLTKERGVQDYQSIFWNQVAQMVFVLCLTIVVRPKLRRQSGKETVVLVLGGILRASACVLLCLSFLHALPGNTWTVLLGLGPVLTIGLSALIAKERPNVVQVTGVVLCVSGVTVIGVSMNNKETNSQSSLQQVLTLMLPISACVLFTLCWVMLRWLSNRGVPLVTHMVYYSMSGILLLPLAYVAEKPQWSFPLGTWGLLVAQTLSCAIVYVSNAAAIHSETAITVQIVRVMTAPVTFVMGYVVLGMAPNVLEMSGGTVVTVGATAVGLWAWRLNLKEQRRAQLMDSLGFSDKSDEVDEEKKKKNFIE
ncbi:uncharacterized transporter YyaM-like [Branchiostoma lanceolatum]|uniref:uncharacterized transporter YyaM-like n=1 Tax=Branchiostoma lanceolatum TaxID=7740 RepID=UPI00345678F5